MKNFAPVYQKDQRTEGMQYKTADSRKQTATVSQTLGDRLVQPLRYVALATLAITLLTQGIGNVMAQNIPNNRTGSLTRNSTSITYNYTPNAGGTYYSSGTVVWAPDSQKTNNWWGGTGGVPNVVSHLNTGGASTSVIWNVSALDTQIYHYAEGDKVISVTRTGTGALGDEYQYTNGYGGAFDVFAGPVNSRDAWEYTGGGTINIGAGATSTLRTSVASTTTAGGIERFANASGTSYATATNASNGSTYTSPGRAWSYSYADTDHFLIAGTAATVKDGAGMLDLQINRLEIETLTGTQGTIRISENNAGSGTFTTGTLDSTTVVINSAVPTIVGSNYGQTAQADFSFVSEDGTVGTHRWEIGEHTNLGANTAAGNFTSSGLNNLGYILLNNDTNNVTFNGVTNIGKNTADKFGNAASGGYLYVSGTGGTLVGTAGTSVFNVQSDSEFETEGLFSVGTGIGSTTYVNDVWGGDFTTNSGTILARALGSLVIENISDSTRTNIGDYFIGENGEAELNIFSGSGGVYNGNSANAGVLNSTDGDVIFGVESGSEGTGNVYGTGSQLNQNDINQLLIIGQEGTGTLNAYWSGHVYAAGETIVAEKNWLPEVLGDGAVGHVNVFDQGQMDSILKMTVAKESQTQGDVNVYTGGLLNVGDTANASDLIIAEQGTGVLNVYNEGSAVTVFGETIVAQDDWTNQLDPTRDRGAHGTINVWDYGYMKSTLDMTVARDPLTEGYINIFDHGLMEVGDDSTPSNMVLAEYGKGVAQIYNYGTLHVFGDMITAQFGGSRGTLYAWDNATVWVEGDKTIAEARNSYGQEYYDGTGTTLTVGGTLTVGQAGYAGGFYSENRYDPRFDTLGKAGEPGEGYFTEDGHDPDDWFEVGYNVIGTDNITFNDTGSPLTDLWHPHGTYDTNNLHVSGGEYTGNAPGLAIVRGATATSLHGIVGDLVGSNGYVLIDDKGTRDGFGAGRSSWTVTDTLTVGNEGTGFLRVLNGGLLQTGTTHLGRDGGAGTVHAIGNDAVKFDADFIANLPAGYRIETKTEKKLDGTEYDTTYVYNGAGVLEYVVSDDGQYVLDADGKFIAATPYGNRTEWFNEGAMVIGEVSSREGRGTVRINDGAYAETHGLYIGYAAGTRGEVSVMGRASELHVFEDTSAYKGSTPAGSGLFAASDWAFVQLHQGAEVKVSDEAVFSNGATLFLEGNLNTPALNPVFSTMDGRFTMVNARIVGIGTIGGEKGVQLTQDDYYTEGQAYIDPGLMLLYNWNEKCESPYYYGTLTFGDQLFMTGNVITRFDLNADGDQDHIEVRRMGDSTSAAPITATLGGTLQVHARATDYYGTIDPVTRELLDPDVSFEVVHTYGDNGVAGKILGNYDELEMVPWRFFNDIQQEVLKDGDENDVLWITMTRNLHPFQEAGDTYNTRQTGKALDEIYNLNDEDWLPMLRNFWYLGDPDFVNAIRLFSGEIRAHSLRLPMQNVWQFAHNRVDPIECDCWFGLSNPCVSTDVEPVCRSKLLRDTNLWGSMIYEENNVQGDGNAFGYDIFRRGIVVGADKKFRKHTFGVMFAYDEGELRSFRSEAESDDFQFGLYHNVKFRDDRWEWKNYLGMGLQDYDMSRSLDLDLAGYCDDAHIHGHELLHPNSQATGTLRSSFLGYTLSGSTEIARPFYFGKCSHYVVRPYLALDLAGVWQNRASETGDFADSNLVALNYLSATDIRIYGRPGLTVRRDGAYSFLRGGISYSFLMGGHPYTDVNNQFQFRSEDTHAFNIRSSDFGCGILSGNVGAGFHFGKRKQGTAWIDYTASSGSRSVAQTLQLGVQKRF